jgi:hypothetical protein
MGLHVKGDDCSWAVASPDDTYRYLLCRRWNPRQPLDLYVMINPSTARHDRADPTMKKCYGFSRRRGAGGFLIGNLFAYSTPYVNMLQQAHRQGLDIVGPRNASLIAWARYMMTGKTIVAWGRVPPKLRGLAITKAEAWPDTLCFGYTKDGFPCHPLMLAYDTPLIAYEDRVAA